MTKRCPKCDTEKPKTEFYKRSNRKSGLASCCKDCSKAYYEANREHKTAYSKEWRAKPENKAKQAITERNWRLKNPERKAAHERKRRAKQLEVDECYTAKDALYTKALFNHRCFSCEATEGLAIDHNYPLDNGFALTLTNAVLLCTICNSTKGTQGPEEVYTLEQIDELKRLGIRFARRIDHWALLP